MRVTLCATLFLLTPIALPGYGQGAAALPDQPSEKTDLAHRNPAIHWPAGKAPTEAQSFSHNEGLIGTPCETVFKYLADPPSWPTFLVFSKDVQMEGAGPLGVGSRFRWVIFGSPIESEVAEFEPGRRIAWTNLKSGFYQTWLLQARPGGCRVTTEEAGFGPVAAHMTATGNVGTHRAHDLWLASLRWVAEGDASAR